VDIVPPFISHAQAPLLVLPRVGSFNHPPMPPQSLLRFDAGPRNSRGNAASTQLPTVLARRVRLVTVQFAGPMPWTTTRLLHLRHSIEQREQFVRVVDVGPCQALCQWLALGVDEKMMLATRLRSVRRVLAREGPPFEARTDEESIEARLKSTRPCCPNSLSRLRWSCSNTPARVHCSRRLQAVIPDKPNCFCGSISHGMPVLSTKTMASKAARSSARGRPRPAFFFLGTGSSGATLSHSASGTSSRAMGPRCSWPAYSSTVPSTLKPYFC
jgi:hypothetical protein